MEKLRLDFNSLQSEVETRRQEEVNSKLHTTINFDEENKYSLRLIETFINPNPHHDDTSATNNQQLSLVTTSQSQHSDHALSRPQTAPTQDSLVLKSCRQMTTTETKKAKPTIKNRKHNSIFNKINSPDLSIRYAPPMDIASQVCYHT